MTQMENVPIVMNIILKAVIHASLLLLVLREEHMLNLVMFVEVGFTDDEDGWCIGHDGTKDTSGNSATGIKNDFALLVLILAILI